MMQIEPEGITSKAGMVRRYLIYRFNSLSRYGVHSPFVYGLFSNILRDRKKYNEYKVVEKIRSDMLSDRREIEFTDLGTGRGKKAGNDVRLVCDIMSGQGCSVKFGRLMFRLCHHLKPDFILELGTSLGLGSLYLACGNPEAKIITIEGCEAVAAVAAVNFQKAGCRIKQIIGDFDKCIPAIFAQNDQKVGMVYFDGNHSCEATLRYFEMCIPMIGEKSVFIFDDIQWSDGMRSAWSAIKANKRVTVTIDLFSVGIVFFDSALSKEDFVLRF